MDNDQITALAREYAEFTDTAEVNKKYISAICENFFKYMLRRYCLVEKEAVRKEYQDSYKNYKTAGDARPLSQQHFRGRCFALESLFPEIAKEMQP